MAKYTIEDIEILRQKSGISYEEAVNLLEYHNGSLARALVDLEKNGRLKSEPSKAASHKGIKGFFDFLFRLRIKVQKKNIVILNLSSLFMLVALAISPDICVVGLIVSLVLGYKISIDRNSQDFANDHLDDLVKNAKSNVQQAVSDMTKQFSHSDAAPENNNSQDTETPRSETAPSGTKPVNVQFPDGGSVNVREDGDGYHEADIRKQGGKQ